MGQITKHKARPIWGVLGGMGPLASNAFLHTIHSATDWKVEQHAPRVILLSDPSIPDRTASLRNGQRKAVVRHAEASIRALRSAGASKIVPVCFTLHAFLPELRAESRQAMVSLVDTGLKRVAAVRRRTLLMATAGSYENGIFTRSRYWGAAARYVKLLNADDLKTMHELLYQLKVGESPLVVFRKLKRLAVKYRCSAWLLGCTELHLVGRAVREKRAKGLLLPKKLLLIDPLECVAGRINGLNQNG